MYEETVLDLSRLDFCDCVGIGALVAARNMARRSGHRLRVRNAPGHLQRLLHATRTCLTGTDPRLPDGGHIGSPGPAPAARDPQADDVVPLDSSGT
ncbi:STAS domain-containing protein [Streptomyces sp. NPDC057909]|uniref:STAS domain-containing protein n=1 Tax=Streptomyces sp. NPDC057909 TaxID=3346277 RepID=UPI0036EC52A8